MDNRGTVKVLNDGILEEIDDEHLDKVAAKILEGGYLVRRTSYRRDDTIYYTIMIKSIERDGFGHGRSRIEFTKESMMMKIFERLIANCWYTI